MSEWLKEHAWKFVPLARADARRNAPTQHLSKTSRNKDVHRTATVNHRVWPAFRGAPDTVLTQNSVKVGAVRTDERKWGYRCDQLRFYRGLGNLIALPW